MDKKAVYVIFGSGNYGQRALQLLGNENIAFFIDNDFNKQGALLDGIQIISFEQALLKIRDHVIVIAVSDLYYKEIQVQLERVGITRYISLKEIQQSITKQKILSRPDFIQIYKKNMCWIKMHTLNNLGIVNNSTLIKPYPEVTGYYIPSLIRWGYRELAVQYANWLMDIQKTDGSWYDTDDQSAYIFDSAQILKGLLAIWDIYPDKNHLEKAIRDGVNWILSCMTSEGRLVTPDETCWGSDEDTCSELIHTYCLSPIIEAGKRLDNDEYIQKAHLSLEYYTLVCFLIFMLM